MLDVFQDGGIMIQILGLRQNKQTNKRRVLSFDLQISAPSIQDIFKNPNKYIQKIPKEEKFNLYYTSFNSSDKQIKDFVEQHCVTFDIDKVAEGKYEDVAKIVCGVLRCEYYKTISMCSGHGVQVIVPIEQAITEEQYFKDKAKLYKLICAEIQGALDREDIVSEVDPTGWNYKKLLRYPNTINRKKNLPDVKSYILNGHFEQHGWSLDSVIKFPETNDTISKEEFKTRARNLDAKAVLEECLYMRHCEENAADLEEPLWYGMVGVGSHLPNGREIVHRLSKPYKGYSVDETNRKIDQALMVGPRTCENIDTLWDGCGGCKHYGKVTCPAFIKGEDFIETKPTNFYHIIETKTGEKKVPAYEDLVKNYQREYGSVVTLEKNLMWMHDKNKGFWVRLPEPGFKNYVYNVMKPRPRSSITNEAWATIQNVRFENERFFTKSEGKVNLKNGVFDIKTGELMPQSEDFGFRYCLDFDYDANAKCPNFEQFLRDVTLDDEEMQKLLMEFVGYTLSGDDEFHKALLLIGDGRNGKSTFNRVVKKLIGYDNFCSVPLSKLEDQQFCAVLDGKLANIVDENKKTSLLNSEVFKSAVACEDLQAKVVYAAPYKFQNRAKFIVNCNHMPVSQDKSLGFYERLILVPFNNTFTGSKAKKRIAKDELFKELPGIFNLAINGYRRLINNDDFTESDKSNELLDLLKDTQDTVEIWFHDSYKKEDGKKNFVSQKDLYADYLNYCEANKIRYPESRQHIAMYINKETKKMGGEQIKRYINGTQVRGILGIEKIDIGKELF